MKNFLDREHEWSWIFLKIGLYFCPELTILRHVSGNASTVEVLGHEENFTQK